MVMGHCSSYNYFHMHFISSFHMPFFFIVSGLLFSAKDRINYKKQFKSLMIPYFVFETIFGFLLCAFNHFNGVWDCFYTMITLKGLGATWFLPCLFGVECLFYITKKIGLFQIPVIVCLSAIGLIFKPIGLLLVLFRIFVGLGFFAVGAYLPQFFQKQHKWYFLIISIAIYVFSTVFNSEVSFVGCEFGIIPLSILSGLTGTFCLIQFSILIHKYLSILGEKIEFFGRNTLVILCTHMIFIEIIRLLDYKMLKNVLPALGAFESFAFAFIVIILEIPTIIFSNKYLWFLYGKGKPKTNTVKDAS